MYKFMRVSCVFRRLEASGDDILRKDCPEARIARMNAHRVIMREEGEMICKLDGCFLRVFSVNYEENLVKMP